MNVWTWTEQITNNAYVVVLHKCSTNLLLHGPCIHGKLKCSETAWWETPLWFLKKCRVDKKTRHQGCSSQWNRDEQWHQTRQDLVWWPHYYRPLSSAASFAWRSDASGTSAAAQQPAWASRPWGSTFGHGSISVAHIVSCSELIFSSQTKTGMNAHTHIW